MDFQTVRAGLSAGDVFTDPAHAWKQQTDRGWAGGCPHHGSESGTCFHVDPETLSFHCFSCGREGGPLEYAAELQGLSPGASFFEQWQALSDLTGCEGPPAPGKHAGKGKPGKGQSGTRRPLKRLQASTPKRRAAQPAAARTTPTPTDPTPAGAGAASSPRYPEQQLRRRLMAYRKALTESDTPAAKGARAYVEGRGLSVELLHAYGCGYAAPGEWLQDGSTYHRAPQGRIVTPHTSPAGQLVNLYGRAVGTVKRRLKHRHLSDNPKALFNGQTIRQGEGPLVVCEASLDALSLIQAGHARTVAVHGKEGLPWAALRGSVSVIVFALDEDARDQALRQAEEATLRGYEAHVLPMEAYGGHGDPSEALQHGALSLAYLQALQDPTEDAAAEQAPAGSPTEDPEAQAPAPETEQAVRSHQAAATAREPEQAHTTGEGDPATWARIQTREHPDQWTVGTPDDLPGYWGHSDTGYLAMWLWTYQPIPPGPIYCEAGVYVDRELLKWLRDTIEHGPEDCAPDTRERMDAVLWRLWAAYSDERDGPPPAPGTAVTAPFPSPLAPEGTVLQSYFCPDRKAYRVAVAPDSGLPDQAQYFDLGQLSVAER